MSGFLKNIPRKGFLSQSGPKMKYEILMFYIKLLVWLITVYGINYFLNTIKYKLHWNRHLNSFS